MSSPTLHAAATWVLLVSAPITFFSLLRVAAPYGRHLRSGWGPQMPARLAWMIMEAPSCLFFLFVFLRGSHAREAVPLFLLFLWQLHYIHRTFLFPFRLRARGKTMPVAIVAMAIAFNFLNAYVNAGWISHFGLYPSSWFRDPRLWLGTGLFALGFAVNQWADAVLLRLRRPGETGYRIPRGGLYQWVSCPNYLGEIVQWLGWALATWSLAGLAFAFYTAANLVPRAMTHHRWYHERFADYPVERRAILPGLL